MALMISPLRPTEGQDPMEYGGKKAARQASLLEALTLNGYLSLEDISTRFKVTTQTARRDVMDLEREGKLRRMHGGAMIMDTVAPSELHRRRVSNVHVKQRIAERVADLVPDGAAVFIDTGTTCETIAHALARRRNLRILTYSLRTAAWLREATDFIIAIPGGFVRQVDGGVFHEEAETFLDSFRFDVSIVSVSGIDAAGNLGDDDLAEVRIVQRAMRHSERVILAVDSSKFDHRGLVRLGSFEDVDVLVTDRDLPAELCEILRQSGTMLEEV